MEQVRSWILMSRVWSRVSKAATIGATIGAVTTIALLALILVGCEVVPRTGLNGSVLTFYTFLSRRSLLGRGGGFVAITLVVIIGCLTASRQP